MNLALHGFLLQVFLSILNFKHGFRLCSAGEPGYLDFDNLPETNFSCQGKVIGGYYADVEAGCQMFHVCTIGQKDEIMDIKFLCLNGTVFDQETRVCERVDEVDCSKSERFYNLNLELYGNNAVTLSLHEGEDDDDSTEPRDEQQQQQQHHMTSARPSTTSTTSTTTSRPSQPSTTSASFQQHPTGYPQHYQPRPAFPNQASQSNTHYDDKNSGYHHQYIFHNDERSNNNQATSYQLFSNQGVSSTTPTPQVHQQVRYSSTANPQIVHNEPSTATPHQYHVQSTSSTIQTLLSSNGNSQSIINPLFHNHGIASTTEQFNIHNNSPRDIDEYNDNSEEENEEREERRPLEPVQSTNKGKVSQLSIAPVPQQEKHSPAIQMKNNQNSQQQRISINYLPTPNPIQTTIRAFYPTQRSTSQKPQKQQNNQQVTQHIHISPPPSVPQLKSHQITINLPPPNIQRIVQNPSPLLPSQSRVIVTAKASVSDESGRPLNASQLITLPIPTIPSAYDDYREGDESFDPFYRDVPRIRNDRRIIIRKIETSGISLRKKRSATYETDDDEVSSEEIIFNAEIKDIKDLKANLPIIKAILFGLPIPENEGHPPDSENIEYADINESNEEQFKSLNIPEHISLSTSQSDHDNTKLLIVNKPEEEKETKTRMIDRQQSGRRIPYTTNQRQIISNPDTAEQASEDARSKDTVHLYLQSLEGNNSSSAKANSSTQFGFTNPFNETHIVDSKTGKIKPELLQTRSSSSSNKSSRRKNHSRDSSDESEEYLPRRNTRIGRPVSPRHYDEYDVSESIEIRSKQKANRSRPKDRRVINYRNDDYVDEYIDDKEYDEENAFRNRKSMSRRGPQGRRVPYRNRNRHFDYEDGIEVDEKPGVRTKAPNNTNKSKVRTHPSRYSEDIRRRPESERRKNSRRRPQASAKDVVTQNNTEIIDTPIPEVIDPKSTKDIDPHATIQEERKVSRYSPKNHEDKPHSVSGRNRSNSLERDEELVEDLNEDREDYLDQSEPYPDDYNDSEERDFIEEYVDYADLRPRGGRTKSGSRRNRNRFEDDFVTAPRKNSHRREKSRKLVDKTVDQRNQEITTEIGDIVSTTILDDSELRTTSLTTEYPVSDETLAPPDLGDDETPSKTTSLVINKENTDRTELTKMTKEKTSTEGVFKFTDELPESAIEDDAPDDGKEDVELNEEDYVDDNYEPDSYITPKIEDTTTSSLQPEEKTNQPSVIINDQQLETKDVEGGRGKKDGNTQTENTEEYDEVYEDKLESTTITSSSEDYVDSATTIPIIFTSSASSPKSKAPTTASSRSTFTSTKSPTSSAATITTITTTTTTKTSTTTSASPSSVSTISTTTTPNTTASTPSSTIRMKSTAKFVKPIAPRKNYVYNPPSTSPNSVVIRRGQPLSGPKPTKPPPSYNELAPKPVIRRLPLLSRTTTTTSESSILEDEIAAELSRHLAEEASRHSGIPSTSLETITYSTPYSSTLRNNEIPVGNSDSNENSDQKLSKEQGFDNEVPKQIPESHNVTQIKEDTVAETSKPDIESTTLSEGLSDLETTLKKVNGNFQISDVQTTTLRTNRPSERRKLELTSVKTQIQKGNQSSKRTTGFNCLEKEMYRFYGDIRDCRLFHYCSPGFTARQVLDFRFVCEEGTIFDEDSQSCLHDVPNPKCVKRTY